MKLVSLGRVLSFTHFVDEVRSISAAVSFEIIENAVFIVTRLGGVLISKE